MSVSMCGLFKHLKWLKSDSDSGHQCSCGLLILLGPIEWEFQLIQVTKLHNTSTTQLLQALAIGQEKALD